MSSPAPPANVRLRQSLADALAQYVADEGLTQTEAAVRLGVTQPRVSDLVRGKVERFTIDALVAMLERVERPVSLGLGPDTGPGALLSGVLDAIFPFVALLDTDGTLLEVNRSVFEASDVTPDDVNGRPFWEGYWFGHDPDLQATVRGACARAARAESVAFNAVVRTSEAGRLPVDVRVQPVRDEAGRVTHLVASAVDVSRRAATEAAWHETEAQYRTLFESIDEGFCVLEMISDDGRAVDYRFVEANPAFEQHTGLVDAVGRTACELVPGLERYWVETYARVAETGEAYRFSQGSAAMGREFSVEAFRVGPAEARRVGLLFTDVTEQKRAEAALREANETLEEQVEARTHEVRHLAQALTMAEQEVRRRIAHVLHDDLQQLLHGAQIEARVADAERVEAVLDRALRLTRSLSHELSPPVLRGDEVGVLLRALAEQNRQRHGLDVAVEADEVAIPEEHLRILLYQIVGELLFNVAKHAGTDRATVRAARVDGHVRVEVHDEGVGFEPPPQDALRGGGGLGLPTVWERVTLVGGRLDVASTPGEGTRVTLDLPSADA
jgi:PAS domain S-box-containing protein